MPNKKFAVTDDSLRFAERFGWGEQTRSKLIQMAEDSAPLSHTLGNARYEHFVLRIEGRSITFVGLVSDGKILPNSKDRRNAARREGKQDLTGAIIIEDRRTDKFGRKLR